MPFPCPNVTEHRNGFREKGDCRGDIQSSRFILKYVSEGIHILKYFREGINTKSG